MSGTNGNTPHLPPEQFDLNQAELEGIVQKVWGREQDVFARLAVYDALQPDGSPAPPRYVTLRFPGGKAIGEEDLLSLQPGDALRILGYLVDNPYTETLRQFMSDAKAPDFLENTPNPEDWLPIQIKRVSTLVETQSCNPTHVEKGRCFNRVQVQGIVSKTWESGGSLFARLAIYDRHTRILDPQPGKNGRPRRAAHYVTVVFPEGKAGERAIRLKPRNRLRVSGSLTTRFYPETLREILLRVHKVDLLTNLPNSDRAAEIRALRTATYVVAQSTIVFASLERAEE
jgi:hypothetical protein